MKGCVVADAQLSLASSDFELFGVPLQFSQDRAVLDARWKDLQREAHPDRFAGQVAALQRQAMQWSVRINEAYQRLKDPLKRAAYLCELGGAAINAENNTAMPPEFLMQQIEWRESLDEARTAQDVDALNSELIAVRRDLLEQLEQALDVQRDLVRAVALVRSLMFIGRFSADIDKRCDQLAENATTTTPAPASACSG